VRKILSFIKIFKGIPLKKNSKKRATPKHALILNKGPINYKSKIDCFLHKQADKKNIKRVEDSFI
jgi:hypothetical protein